MTELPKKRQVLATAFITSVVAYFSAGAFPDPLAFGPLAPMMLIFALYPIASAGGWPAFVALFIPVYFTVCSILSIGLLLRYKRAWEIAVSLFIALTLANGAYFSFAWQYGVRWQGAAYTWLMLGLNVAVGSTCAILLWQSKRNPQRPLLLLAAHGSILFWLSWASFPWLGELI